MVQIKVQNLEFSYKNGPKSLNVLQNLSFEVKKGEFVAILGPSGCGKTTLLNCLAGLLQPTGGQILIDNQKIKKPGEKTAMVFQEALLLPWRNVLKNVTFGLEIKGMDEDLAQKKAREIIASVGLSNFENYYPHQLSGGMKQRVNLARALASDTQILLLDEPFAHLDKALRKTLQKNLLYLHRTFKKTFIFVTHQLDEAKFLAQKLIILKEK